MEGYILVGKHLFHMVEMAQCGECEEHIDVDLGECPECGYNAPRHRILAGVMMITSGLFMTVTLLGGILGVPMICIGVWNLFKARQTSAAGGQINPH